MQWKCSYSLFISIGECICWDCSTEPHAEPGIFQSHWRLFRSDVQKPENQFSKVECAAREWSTIKGRYYQSNKVQKGTGKSQVTISGLQYIGYRIMLKCSDGTQEESTTLNTFPVGGGVARQTHTNGNHLGYIYFDVLNRADETYARTHPKR